jgi:hypothetical protein
VTHPSQQEQLQQVATMQYVLCGAQLAVTPVERLSAAAALFDGTADGASLQLLVLQCLKGRPIDAQS